MDPLTTNLLSAALVSVSNASQRKANSFLRKQKISDELGEVETEFNEAFRKSLIDAAKRQNNSELENLAIHWDVATVAEELNSTDHIFDSEDAAIDRIVVAIESAEDIQLRDTDRSELQLAVAEAYQSCVGVFLNEIAGTELGDELELQLGISAAQTLQEMTDRFDRLVEKFSPRRRYWLFEHPQNTNSAIRAIEGTQQTDFVSRPELSMFTTSNRTFILGPAGSGKTRAVGEILRKTPPDNVEHIFVPKPELNFPGDAQRLEQESFDGDVLLVWDDIHKITEHRDNRVFEEIYTTLESMLNEQGYGLQVLLTARSGNLDDIPGDVVNRQGRWSEDNFDYINLAELSKDRLREIVNGLAEAYNVEISESDKDLLLDRAHGKSAPFYLSTVFRSNPDSTITSDVVNDLPESVDQLWQSQYEILSDENKGALVVLEAAKLLHDLHLRRFGSLVLGVYQHVLGWNKRDYRQSVKSLIDRQWLSIQGGSDPFDDRVEFQIHDIQLEAVNVHISEFVNEFSRFLLEKADEFASSVPLPEEPSERGAMLNAAFAVVINEFYPDWELVRTHFEHAIAGDDTNPIWMYEFGQVLRARDQFEEAAHWYLEAIEVSDNYPHPHIAYAILLDIRVIEVDKENRYELALDHLRTALRIDPQEPSALNTLAKILGELNELESAESVYRSAVEAASREISQTPSHAESSTTDGDFPIARVNYATFLMKQNRDREAEEQFQQALQEFPENALVHLQYGNFLTSKLNQYEKGRSHLCDYLDKAESESYMGVALFNLASVSYELGDEEAASRYLYKLRTEYPEKHKNMEDAIRNM